MNTLVGMKLVCLTLIVPLVSAGFYADNGLDRTISYRSLPKQEKREMENEILNLLGLDHRPKPKIHQTSNSAPKYLIELYNKLDPESEDRNASLKDVDFVVSFVNHHNNEEDELSIEPKLHFDVSDISPQETIVHASLNLYRMDTRRKLKKADVDEDADEGEVSFVDSETSATQSETSASPPGGEGITNFITPPALILDPEAGTGTSTTGTSATEDTSPESRSIHLTVEVVTSIGNKSSTKAQTTSVDSITEAAEPSLGDVGSGQEAPASSQTLRKARSISPPLDYNDDFQFFDQPFEIQVFTIRHGNSIGEIALDPVATYLMGANETGWVQLNSTNPLLNWVGFPKENFGLVVRLVDPESGLQLSPAQVGLVMGATGEFAPFMAAFMKEGSGGKRRSTRASEKSRREKPPVSYINDDVPSYEIRHHFSRKNFCQKRTLYVSFRDLGWQDWIIAPDGYSAFYCDGECSFPLNMNATNHAIVQTLVHLVSPGQAPTACCAPTKLAPIMVLYFDDNSNVILKKYKNMVVRSCGCH